MKKFLFATTLCLGLAGAGAANAQQALFVTNQGLLQNNGFPANGNGFISIITPNSSNPAIGDVSTMISGITGPGGIAYDGAGSLIYGQGFFQASPGITGSINRYNLGSGVNTVLSSGTTLQGPAGLVTTGGNIYNINSYFVTPTLTVTPAAGNGGTNPSTLRSFNLGDGVYGLAYNATIDATHFYVTASPSNGGADSILRINTATGATDSVITSPAFDAPTDLTFGPDGALYVSNNGNDNILRIAAPASGTPVISLYATNAFLSPLLDGPEGLAFAPGTNDLYVASDENTVARIPGTNVAGTLVAGAATQYADLGPDANPMFLAFSPVPEPSTYVMLGVAGVVLTFALRRRQSLTLRA